MRKTTTLWILFPYLCCLIFMGFGCTQKSDPRDPNTNSTIEVFSPMREPGETGYHSSDATLDAISDDMSLEIFDAMTDMSDGSLPGNVPLLLEEELQTPIFRWRPLLGETGESVQMRLSGGAKLGSEGLDLSSSDAFAYYTLPPEPLVNIIQSSGEVSIRLWVKSMRELQGGPARIFTWSSNTDLRNLTLGQGTFGEENGGLTLRIRLDRPDDPSSLNGLIGGEDLISTGVNTFEVSQGWYHLVAQYRNDGHVELWVNRDLISRVFEPVGLSSWVSNINFGLGQEFFDNEPSNAPLRSWSGIIGEVAIYPLALSREEILTYMTGGN